MKGIINVAKKEEVVMLEDKINYYVPSDDIQHNLLLDTCAINEIVKSTDVICAIKELKNKGFIYYISDVQMRELSGIIDRKEMKMTVDETIKESNKSILSFLKDIDCKRVSCVALLLEEFWVLDGSFRLIDENSSTYTMFKEIHNNNIHHIKDAVIAEAAIYNNCTLITKDRRLNKKVNQYFSGRSILCKNFINEILSSN